MRREGERGGEGCSAATVAARRWRGRERGGRGEGERAAGRRRRAAGDDVTARRAPFPPLTSTEAIEGRGGVGRPVTGSRFSDPSRLKGRRKEINVKRKF